MAPKPTSERPVGGSALRAFSVVKPPKRHLRAYAALAPKAIVLARARAQRRRLSALPIAITGSVGKTTTKHLLTAALRTAGPTVALVGNSNRAQGLAEAVAMTDRATQFLVQEIGAARAGAGTLDELLWALEPRVSVITTVHSDHLAGFGGADGVAQEKRKAIAVLPATGLAVLNADDPRVLEMATAAGCRVVLVGRASDADVRIDSAELDPNGRVVVRLTDGTAEHTVATQLVGVHWATAVALAFATATRLGADPSLVIRALAAVPPSRERLDLVTTPAGVLYLVDTSKATEATVSPAFAALAGIPARRRVAVIGLLLEFVEGSPSEIVGRVTDRALSVADQVLLYGRSAANAPEATAADPRVRLYSSIRALSDDLWAEAQDGDLVLLMGTLNTDHLSRVALRVTHDVRCWRDDCRKRTPCDRCPLLGPIRA